jgi:predicted small lipoprotein YifL
MATLSRSSNAFFIVGLNLLPPVLILSLSVWNPGQTIFLILTGGANQAFEILNNFRTPEECHCGSSLAPSALNLVFCYDGIKAAVITVRLPIGAFGSIGDKKISPREGIMTSFKKLAIPALAGILMLGGLTACDRKGPMERAGEKVDKTVEKAGDKVERATDK